MPKTQTGGTFFADKLSLGQVVYWKREVYRMPMHKRPVDSGVVLEKDGCWVAVVAENGQVVRGNAICFHATPENL